MVFKEVLGDCWDFDGYDGYCKGDIHPPKQTWNLKMDPWKRRFLLETTISRFHVNVWGCMFPDVRQTYLDHS